jgi:hypothetical protein
VGRAARRLTGRIHRDTVRVLSADSASASCARTPRPRTPYRLVNLILCTGPRRKAGSAFAPLGGVSTRWIAGDQILSLELVARTGLGRGLLQDSDELVAAVAARPGQSDEFAGVLDDRAALWTASHADTAAAAELEQPLVPKDA